MPGACDYSGLMTTSQIPFTADNADDAPSVDINGDSRFVTETEWADGERAVIAAEDEAANEYYAEQAAWEWEQEQRERGLYFF